jgi:hypothetical protein
VAKSEARLERERARRIAAQRQSTTDTISQSGANQRDDGGPANRLSSRVDELMQHAALPGPVQSLVLLTTISHF